MVSHLVDSYFGPLKRELEHHAGWLSVQHLFMSGVTFLSCLTLGGTDMALPPLVEAMLDIQACSGVLEALTGESCESWLSTELTNNSHPARSSWYPRRL
jgi:hypothetical protein